MNLPNLLEGTKALLAMTAGDPTEAAQAISDSPGYMIPCPSGSTIGLPEIPDRIVQPSLSVGRRTGTTLFSPCCLECPVCGGFQPYFDNPEQAAIAWVEYLLKLAGKDLMFANKLANMEKLGLLPETFASRLAELLPF